MRRKQRPAPGARPGTLVLPEGAVPPRIRVIHYTPDAVEERDVQSAAEAAPPAEGVSWIDVQGLGDEGVLRSLAETFSIHPLALEDVVHVPQRPKTESYAAHQLYITRMVRPGAGAINAEQVSLFWGDSYVLSFQEQYGDVLDPVRKRIREGQGRPIRKSGPDYLAYAILDSIIDGYYPVLEAYGETIEELEDLVVTDAVPSTLTRVNEAKRDLMMLRRGIWPQRDALTSLIRGDSAFVGEDVRVFLRDSYDHCVQMSDVLESYRELAGGLLATYLSSVANRTNDVMKVLTIMASIFIPLTFLAGIYGMNFESMPELRLAWAYPALLAVMAATAAVMFWIFKRRGWIGRSADRAEDS